jgi:phosphatidylglycerophosphatase A
MTYCLSQCHARLSCYDPMVEKLAYHIATVLGLGDRLPAPGTTAGSLPAIAGWWLAMVVLDEPGSRLVATIAGTVIAVLVGVWASQREGDRRGAGDPGPVVIDEVAGQWLTMIPVLLLLAEPTAGRLGLASVAGFVLFRLFDVVKPWPVRSLEKIPGGLGIMADDLAAGVYAAGVLAAGIVLIG